MEPESMPGFWPRQPAAADRPPGAEEAEARADQNQDQGPQQEGRRRYGPRTCRICLETVLPTFPEGIRTTFGLRSNPRPVYMGDDPELGRLISPCTCKGSQKFVHQGCLQAWRDADPLNKRHYFHCPTCHFKYRLGRMSWARWLSSGASQMILTIMIVSLAVFLLGFVADPILDLWIDPISTIADGVNTVVGEEGESHRPLVSEADSWLEHFVKGFFSLGIVGFLKVFWTMSPWHWWNLRTSGIMNPGRRPGTTGRGRVESISWAVVIVGAITVIYSMWKGVRFLSRRTLLAASDGVLDVGADDDDEFEEEHEHDE
ncbi:related to RING finger domain protein [Cephalotrichum gorgonifer]|uniref:Related to RING finger domain protein n=1 Tax=Cephalotrichum gorgonifer TaxID=2041049 RepID=A0AAE8N114_9PEZI|nr:related to RING finger domain protein [Cephalotrichum gorgonifer]